MKCKKCGCEEFETKTKGRLTGLYCTECGTWQKWVGKDEVISKTEVTPKPSEQNCNFCREGVIDIVIPTSYGDEGINGWVNVDAVYCPMCGRKLGGNE